MSGEGFLARWSRRKRGEAGPEPEFAAAPALPASPPELPAPAEPPTASPETEPPTADRAGLPAAPEAPPGPVALPSLEDLARDGDLGPFLRPDVPRSLRRAALRQAWTLDPAIRDFVGPADYAWDFNAPDGMPGFALELGGNLKELLAQAIGAPREPPPGEMPAEASGGAPDVVAGEIPGAPVSAATNLASADPFPAEAPAPSPVADDGPAPGPAAAAFPSRRHGSAVPG